MTLMFSSNIRLRRVAHLLVTVLVGAAPHVSAQTPPADLSQMSLAELLRVDLGRPSGTWSFDYRFVDAHFEGYLEGRQSLALEDVLFRPGEIRTSRNFPVVPTEMDQRVHVVDVTRQMSPDWRLAARIPWVQQRTHHVSIVPGFDVFSIATGGLGDVSFLATRVVHRAATRNLTVGGGLTLPTGSIDETGQTPRSPDPSTVPYMMQVGSGTTDLLTTLSYTTRLSAPARLRQLDLSLSTQGRWRLGANARHYRLGHQLTTDAQLVLRPWPRLWPSIGATWATTGRISGSDSSLMVPGPFPYPAPISDPSLYGGTLVNLRLGVELPVLGRGGPDGARAALMLQAGRRIFTWLHGPQPPEVWRVMAGWRLSV